MPKQFSPEWRRYFRIYYLYERAFWTDGTYNFETELLEGEPCGLDNFRVTDDEQDIFNI